MADYDPLTDIGRVRFLISDTANDDASRIFEDAEIQMLLDTEGGVKLAAAKAMEVIADNEALLGKKITTQDLTTDGTAVAASLRARATSLRAQAGDEAEGSDESGGFAYVPFTQGVGWPELAEYKW